VKWEEKSICITHLSMENIFWMKNMGLGENFGIN
jgi:hypothetical protein